MFLFQYFSRTGERSEYLAKNHFVLNRNEEEYLIFIAGIYRVLDNNDEDVFFFIITYLFLIDRSVLLIFTLSIIQTDYSLHQYSIMSTGNSMIGEVQFCIIFIYFFLITDIILRFIILIARLFCVIIEIFSGYSRKFRIYIDDCFSKSFVMFYISLFCRADRS